MINQIYFPLFLLYIFLKMNNKEVDIFQIELNLNRIIIIYDKRYQSISSD